MVSINVSGHKYGLTYPGIGFVVWRNADHLPEDLVFRVNYLGGNMPTFTLNFSRSGNQVIGQYYNFLRLGRDGFTQVMRCLSDTAQWLARELAAMSVFEVISDGSAIPVVSFRLKGEHTYTVFDISALLRSYGWQVPAYTMPDNATDVAVLRVVVREGFSANLARALRDDLLEVLAKLDKVGVGGFADEAAFRPLNPDRCRPGTIDGSDQHTDQTQNMPAPSSTSTPSPTTSAVLREHAGTAAVMAVVKADGYGHGAAPVARAALAAGAAELGVATVDEARRAAP